MEDSGMKKGGNVKKAYEVTKVEKMVKDRYCISLHPLKPEKLEVMPTAETEEEKTVMRMARILQYYARVQSIPVQTSESKYPVYSDEDIEICTNIKPNLNVGDVVELSLGIGD